MRSAFHRMLAVLAVVAIALVALMAGSGTATAQNGIPCNQPGAMIHIFNNTTCNVQAMILTDPAEDYISVAVAPNGVAVAAHPGIGVRGVHDSGGFPHFFQVDAVNPNIYWVRNIQMNACFVDVKFDAANCTITYTIAAPPPPPPLEL